MAREICVVVASHERPVRLRWLLAALAAQTLARERWELIVCHDSAGEETESLLHEHPLAGAGVLRHLRLAPGSGHAARQRNLGWRSARAPLIAFTDDDCRPDPRWLEELLGAAARHPDAIVQGRTRPDPDELAVLRAAPHARTQVIDPPGPWGQACNIAYPRARLEAAGGFDERVRRTGEDTDLLLRARAAGAPYVAAPAALVHHAVDAPSLPAALAGAWRWHELPLIVSRHPQLRRKLPLGAFWHWRHAWLFPAAGGLAGARRRPVLAVLALPWALSALPARGSDARGRLRAVSELPGRAALDVVEVAALAWGSLRHRTLFL